MSILIGTLLEKPCSPFPFPLETYGCTSQPKEKRRAAQISFIRGGLNCATRFPKRFWETVTALCRLTAQGALMPSSSFRSTSEGTPRMVEVIGATVTVDKYGTALLRVRTTTGLFLFGGAK
jgi:hypothetical protein